MKNTIKILDLFAGVGGLSYGFNNDDTFNIIAANEVLPDMAKAYLLNHPNVKMFNCDIKNFNINKQIDLIIGGPPCQAYSTVGKRDEKDSRAYLFQEYFRLVKQLNPKMFLFENVTGLLSIQKGQLFQTIIELFKSIGYTIQYKILNSADFGVPQIRNRIFIIGTKSKTQFNFPNKTTNKYLTIKDAISDLPFIGNGQSDNKYSTKPNNDYQKLMRQNCPTILTEHNATKNNEKLIKLMEWLKDGQTPINAPIEFKPTSGFKNTYSKLWWEKPAPTITRNFSTPSSSRCIHPKCPRPLTIREGARIQSFPDNYKFFGSKTSKHLQIGNAVPPLISIQLKNSIKQYFQK